MRISSDRPSKNAMGGWLHPLNGAAVAYTKPERKAEPPSINATRLMAEWRAKTLNDWIERFASELGVAASALDSTGVAWAAPHGAWAFPMFDGNGNRCGIRLRCSKTKRKWAVTGSRQGVFLPDYAPTGDAYVCEGPTDLASALSLGLWAIGRPSCSGGVEDVKKTLRRLRARRAIIIADNDDKTRLDGSSWNPGLDGANKLASELTLPNCVLTLPSKDMRQFVNDGGKVAVIDFILKQTVWNIPTSSNTEP